MSDFPDMIHLPSDDVYQSWSTRPNGAPLGQLAVTSDGRVFRLVKNGATQLAVGLAVQAPAGQTNKAIVVTTYTGAVGTKFVQTTVAAISAGDFKDGYLWVYDSTGAGYLHEIQDNTATDNPATGDILVTLKQGLRVALGSGSKVGLSGLYNGVVVHPSPATTKLIGTTNSVIPASYYFWAQIRGPASMLCQGTVVINELVVDSATVDGAVAAIALTEGTPNTDAGQNPIGTVILVGADTKYGLIDLRLG